MSLFWSDKRVFISGGTGFIGSWLVKRLLAEGSQVFALIYDKDEPEIKKLHRDTIGKTTAIHGALQEYETIEEAFSKYSPDTVFHIGAQAIVGVAREKPLETFESNIRGTYNLLEACRVHADVVKRVVVASSDKAYGHETALPYIEDMPPLGRYPYDVSKSCTDLLAQSYFYSFDLPVVVTRCGNVYGGADLNWSRIVPGTIKSLFHGEAPVIRSDGTFIRDYIYAKDVVGAYLNCAEALAKEGIAGNAFNFAPEKPLSVLEIVASISQLMGKILEPVILNDTSAEIKEQFLSFEKAKRFLNWTPSYTLEDGLRETIDWYKEYFSNGSTQ